MYIYFALQVKNEDQLELAHCGNIDCMGTACCTVPDEIRCAGGTRTYDDIYRDLLVLAKESADFLLGVMPVADSELVYTIAPRIRFRDDYNSPLLCTIGAFMLSMVSEARASEYDYVLAVQPWGICGCCHVGSPGCYIELFTEPPRRPRARRPRDPED